MKQCLNCGKEITSPHNGGQLRKFCNSECYHSFDRGVQRVERVTFTCKICGEPFVRGPGELRSYRKRHGRDPLYCSTKCGGKGRELSDEKWQVNCVQCGKPMPIQRRPGGTINKQKKLCSTACRSQFRHERAPTGAAQSGEFCRREKKGYVWITIPAFLHRSGKRAEMLEHRFIMEKKLGRPLLPTETIHHKNGQRSDNSDENLELWNKAQPPGQRVTDKITFAIDMLRLYPEYAKAAGVMLVDA